MTALSRRQFMRRGALMAAGGLVASTAAGTVAIPGWARWLGEQMEKLQPKPRVEIRQPVTVWTFGNPDIGVPEGSLDLSELKAAIDKLRQQGKLENIDPWRTTAELTHATAALAAYTNRLWLGLKEA